MAAAADKKKYEKFTSPKFVAIWPHLHAADTKFNAAGVYATKGRLDPANPLHQAFMDKLDALHETHIEEVKATKNAKQLKTFVENQPYTPELDEETGDETGFFVFNVKMYATRTDKKDATKIITNAPKAFDARGNPIVVLPKVGGGSTLRVNYSVGYYDTPKGAGITLYLNSFQVIQLVEWNGTANAKSEGFDAEEDGYVTQAEAAAQGFGDEDAGDDSKGAGDNF